MFTRANNYNTTTMAGLTTSNEYIDRYSLLQVTLITDRGGSVTTVTHKQLIRNTTPTSHTRYPPIKTTQDKGNIFSSCLNGF